MAKDNKKWYILGGVLLLGGAAYAYFKKSGSDGGSGDGNGGQSSVVSSSNLVVEPANVYLDNRVHVFLDITNTSDKTLKILMRPKFFSEYGLEFFTADVTKTLSPGETATFLSIGGADLVSDALDHYRSAGYYDLDVVVDIIVDSVKVSQVSKSNVLRILQPNVM